MSQSNRWKAFFDSPVAAFFLSSARVSGHGKQKNSKNEKSAPLSPSSELLNECFIISSIKSERRGEKWKMHEHSHFSHRHQYSHSRGLSLLQAAEALIMDMKWICDLFISLLLIDFLVEYCVAHGSGLLFLLLLSFSVFCFYFHCQMPIERALRASLSIFFSFSSITVGVAEHRASGCINQQFSRFRQATVHSSSVQRLKAKMPTRAAIKKSYKNSIRVNQDENYWARHCCALLPSILC